MPSHLKAQAESQFQIFSFRRMIVKQKVFSIIGVLGMLVALLPASVLAASTVANGPDDVPYVGVNTDNPHHPLGDQQSVGRICRAPPRSVFPYAISWLMHQL
jgi:hypothetical protein